MPTYGFRQMLAQNVLPQNIFHPKKSSLQNILPQNILPKNVLLYKTSSSTEHPPLQNVLLYKMSSSTKCPPLQNVFPTKRPSLQNIPLHSTKYMKISFHDKQLFSL
jgi:hypothetical protein